MTIKDCANRELAKGNNPVPRLIINKQGLETIESIVIYQNSEVNNE